MSTRLGRTVGKLILALLALLVLVPLLRYRTLSPCGMLEKELVRQAEREIEEAGVMARDRASAFGDQAEETVDEVSGVVEDVSKGIAEGVARARVRRMSTGECVSELARAVL